MAKRATRTTKIKGASPADKQIIKQARAANRAEAAGKAPADKAPEGGTTLEERQERAARQFEEADGKARPARPVNAPLTDEQRDIQIRRAATGF